MDVDRRLDPDPAGVEFHQQSRGELSATRHADQHRGSAIVGKPRSNPGLPRATQAVQARALCARPTSQVRTLSAGGLFVPRATLESDQIRNGHLSPTVR